MSHTTEEEMGWGGQVTAAATEQDMRGRAPHPEPAVGPVLSPVTRSAAVGLQEECLHSEVGRPFSTVEYWGVMAGQRPRPSSHRPLLPAQGGRLWL